jgi:cell division protein FtsI (penicillin-binding protein 3)
MFIVLGIILLIPAALGFQLIRINYFEGNDLRSLWSQQAIDQIPIPAQRGNIYDANGTLLATNAVDYKLAFDPKVSVNGKIGVPENQIKRLSQRLAELTPQSAAFYKNKIRQAPARSRYIVLGNNLPPTVKDEIKILDIPGVIIEENYRRKYTFGTLAAHTLGFVNHNSEGKIGLESFYNEILKGEDGIRQVRRDPFNRIFEYVGAPKKLPQNGYSLHTTIDAYIQAILEDELRSGVEKHKANYGTGIIMDPTTGAIKALANYPTFDPNHPGSEEEENRRNFAISDMIEPGSTFKLVTAVAAIEQEVVDFEEIINTPEDGEEVIHDLILRDHDPLGNLSFQEVIQKSSNIATAKIAMRMKADVFYQYARNMGFGTETNIDLSGETQGRLAKPFEWSLVTLPWMSHGYEIQTTPLQITQAYSAFANNGSMMRPYIVERIENKNGKVIQQHNPVEIRKIAKASTLKKLLPVFESVVSDSGTGDLVQVDGLRIAGKTGTAKKVVNGRYTNRYRSSFVGFFPVSNPKYVCLILLDEPKTTGYGGVTAGPIFRNIAMRIAGLDDDIQQDFAQTQDFENNLVKAPLLRGMSQGQAEELLGGLGLNYEIQGKDGYVVSQEPVAGTDILPGKEISLTLSETYTPVDSASIKKGFVEVPDLIGMNMRKAHRLLQLKGLKVEFIGSGTIFAQFPKAGATLRKGYSVTVRGKARSLELITKLEK